MSESAPTKFIAWGLFHQKNIYLCQSPSAFICVYLRFQKKPDYMVEGGSPRAMPLNRETGKPAATKFIAWGLFHQKNIYLCQSPSAFICVYLRFQKKTRLHGRGGFTQSDATKQRDWKTRPYSALLT